MIELKLTITEEQRDDNYAHVQFSCVPTLAEATAAEKFVTAIIQGLVENGFPLALTMSGLGGVTATGAGATMKEAQRNIKLARQQANAHLN